VPSTFHSYRLGGPSDLNSSPGDFPTVGCTITLCEIDASVRAAGIRPGNPELHVMKPLISVRPPRGSKVRTFFFSFAREKSVLLQVLDSKSQTWRLFRSENAKCVFSFRGDRLRQKLRIAPRLHVFHGICER